MVVTKEEEEFGPIKTLYNEMSEVRDERRITRGVLPSPSRPRALATAPRARAGGERAHRRR